MRTATAVINAIIFIVAAMPRLDAMTEPQGRDLKGQIERVPAGTLVELELVDDTRIVGKLGTMTENGLELEVNKADRTVKQIYYLKEIRSVRRTLPSGGLPGSGNLQASPRSVGALVLGRKIKLMKNDGTYLEGTVYRATEEEICMEVKKSEPKGRGIGPDATIPTSEISVIRMERGGNPAAAVALGVLGGVAGTLGSAYAAYAGNMENGAGVAVVAIGMAAGASGGAYLGHVAAKKILTINVLKTGTSDK
jgi:hypothetical protein